MMGTVSRTARVSGVIRNLKEAAGKTPARRTEIAYEADISGREVSQWDQIFPDALMTVAAVDRIIHHASIIEIEGGSYRKKQHLKK